MDKYQLSERDICTKFITPAIQQAGWQQHQFREEVSLTDGRVMVRGKLAARIKNPEAKGGPKRADFVLYARPNVPVGHGMQQASLPFPDAEIVSTLSRQLVWRHIFELIYLKHSLARECYAQRCTQEGG